MRAHRHTATTATTLTAALLACAAGAAPARAEAAATGIVGSTLEDAEVPLLGGGKARLLGGRAVSVLLFVRSGHEHSRAGLRALAALEKELAGRPVGWSVIVSDREPASDVAADVKEAGTQARVIIDVGDALYGRLQVALHPTAGVADKAGKILAWEHFTKINFGEVLRARVRHALGDIDDKALAAALNPEAATEETDANMARRRVKLGEMLLKMKSLDKALDNARKAIEIDPKLAAAHALAGAVLAAQSKCPEARKAFEEALRLEPKNAAATEGLKACAGK